jgi:predicted CoA-binding protein
MNDWQANILEDSDKILELLRNSHRIAVLGIKPASASSKPAHYVPKYLQQQGYEIVPVPTYYPDVEEILGQKVYRTLAEIPGDIDIVDVFRRPDDIAGHVPDIVAKQPRAVWLQLGIRNDTAAQEIAAAGILVVQDRCLKIERQKLVRRSP